MSVSLQRSFTAAAHRTAEGGEVGDPSEVGDLRTEEVAGARAGSAEGGEVRDIGGRATRKRMKLKTQVPVAANDNYLTMIINNDN